MNRIVLAMVIGAAPIAAAAHVVLAPTTVAPGAEYAGAFKIGHGCSGSATVALKVEVPGSLRVAAPAKAGWRMAVVRAVSLGGGGVPPVRTITWRGRLAADQTESFPIVFVAPEKDGPIYFKAIQSCETGEARWVEIATAAQSRRDLKFPAPVLEVTANPAPEAASTPNGARPPSEVQVVDGALRTAGGLPLYTFNFDTMVGMSHCEGECSVKRPPLEAEDDAKPHGPWTVIGRADGSLQWAYKSKPLYSFTGDKPGGPPTGTGEGSNWSIARY